MHRHCRDTETAAQSSMRSNGSQISRSDGLPIIPCPECGLAVKKLVSGTKRNPERVFYRCINQNTRCEFWKWEDDYIRFLRRANIVTPSTQDENVDTLRRLQRLEAQLDSLALQFETRCQHHDDQLKGLVASLDNFRRFNCLIFIVVVVTLIILVFYIGSKSM
ncbi:GRF zinc finger family protein [Rhynchospora pubera]|uniref:GRF zinc finger family protein n=1 Tax=Rhynchospora pubera TaxID=906938 RepID=A0AAV8DFG7_9POAL|nr:GRF zinc finger family protein [Rhynchospora pubera]